MYNLLLLLAAGPCTVGVSLLASNPLNALKAIHTEIINEDRGGPKTCSSYTRDVKQVKCHYVKILT